MKTGYLHHRLKTLIAAGCFVLLLMAGCQTGETVEREQVRLEPVAFSTAKWTGIAVSAENRIFVNYPRWSDNVPVSVAELVNGKPVPYPNAQWNGWEAGKDPATHMVCVQALYVDKRNRLWILDPANPKFKGAIPNGPKLLQVDLSTDEVVNIYPLDAQIASENSYLNDVRVDTENDFAYITDSRGGALIILDLKSGKAMRRLDEHPSTSAEDVVLTIGGTPWMRNGEKIRVHADGIAFDPSGDLLYYQSLTGRTMYRIKASALRQFDLPEASLEAQVEVVGQTGAADGLLFGPDGKVYISALEHDAIFRTTPEGDVETVIQDEAIAWPDSFSLGPDNMLYFTTARIHEGAAPKEKFGLYRIKITRD